MAPCDYIPIRCGSGTPLVSRSGASRRSAAGREQRECRFTSPGDCRRVGVGAGGGACPPGEEERGGCGAARGAPGGGGGRGGGGPRGREETVGGIAAPFGGGRGRPNPPPACQACRTCG